MKAAPLALLLVCAPAAADVAVPQAAANENWADSCAQRIDEAAKQRRLSPGARVSMIPLRHEDGTANPVQYVEYAPSPRSLVTVGDDAERLPDRSWEANTAKPGQTTYFRRYHGRFAKLVRDRAFMAVADECLKMGESK